MFAYFNPKDKVTVSPSIVVFAFALALGLYFLYTIRFILTLVFLAFIIMVALNPAVSKLQRYLKLPRVFSAALVYLIVITSLVTLISVVLPPVVRDMYHLLRTLDMPILQEQLSSVRFTMAELTALLERVGNSVGLVFSVISSTFTGIFTFITLIIMSFYMMLDRPYLHRKIMWVTREAAHIDQAEAFLNKLEQEMGGWVRGQLILMLLIGLITYIGLLILGIPYALPLAVIAGLLEILPNVGPTIAAIPSVILAYATMGPFMSGATILFYIIVQQIENNIIVPKIMKENVGVNPLVAMVTILIGLQTGGMVGALLSVPIYLVIRTIYSMWYRPGRV